MPLTHKIARLSIRCPNRWIYRIFTPAFTRCGCHRSIAQNFAFFLAGGEVLRGWARSACGDTAEGLALIEGGIKDWMATGAILSVPYYLALKAEAFYRASC